jgi:hypothetical protein
MTYIDHLVADALEHLSRAAARRLAGRPRFAVPRRIARRLRRLALRVGWPGFHDIPSLVSHQVTSLSCDVLVLDASTNLYLL